MRSGDEGPLPQVRNLVLPATANPEPCGAATPAPMGACPRSCAMLKPKGRRKPCRGECLSARVCVSVPLWPARCRRPHAGTPSGTLGLGALHRQAAHLRLGVGVDVRPFEPSPDAVAASLSFEVAYLGRDDASSLVLDVGALAKSIKSQFAGHVFGNGQQAAIQFEADARRKLSFKLTCTGFEHVDIGDAGGASAAAAGAAPRPFAQLLASTDVQLTKTKDSVFKVKGGSAS